MPKPVVLLQVQWVQGHNPDLIVLDDNGHEKETNVNNSRFNSHL